MTGLLDLSQELIELIFQHLPPDDFCSVRRLSKECARRCENAFVRKLRDLRFINVPHSLNTLLAIASHEEYASRLDTLRLGTQTSDYNNDHDNLDDDGAVRRGPDMSYEDGQYRNNQARYNRDEESFRDGPDLATLTMIMCRMPRTAMHTIDIGGWDQASEGRCYGATTYERDTLRTYIRCGSSLLAEHPGAGDLDGIDHMFANVLCALSTTQRTITRLDVRQFDWELNELHGIEFLRMPDLVRPYQHSSRQALVEDSPLAKGLRQSFVSLRQIDFCITLCKSGREDFVSTHWLTQFFHLAPNLERLKLSSSEGYSSTNWDRQDMSPVEMVFKDFASETHMPRLKSLTLQNFLLGLHHLVDFLNRHTELDDITLYRVASHFDWESNISRLTEGRTLPPSWKLTLSWLERYPGPEDEFEEGMGPIVPAYVLFNDDGEAFDCTSCKDLLEGFTPQECNKHTSKTFRADELKDMKWTLAPHESLRSMTSEEDSESPF